MSVWGGVPEEAAAVGGADERECAAGAGADASAPGGEAACQAHRLCPECGAMPDQPPPAPCWRCGAVRGPERPPDEAVH